MMPNYDIEKRKPTYDLAAIKAAFENPAHLRATRTAVRAAQAAGLTRNDMVGAVQATDRRHFVKSMTTYADPHVWQDVYNVPYADLVIYLKVMADAEGFLIVSFKEV